MAATTPDLVHEDIVVQHEVVTHTSLRQRVVSGVLLVLLGAVTVEFLAFDLKAGHDAHLKIDAEGSAGSLPNLVLPARYTALALGIVVIALGVWQLARGFSRRRGFSPHPPTHPHTHTHTHARTHALYTPFRPTHPRTRRHGRQRAAGRCRVRRLLQRHPGLGHARHLRLGTIVEISLNQMLAATGGETI